MPELIDLPTVNDTRGDLTHIESLATVPFDIKRVYYLHGVPADADRGGHAHFNLKQVLIAVSGSLTLRTEDARGVEEFALKDPTKGVLLEALTWREMSNFEVGTVCLVLASEHYLESDYIRDYDRFKTELSAN